jgi:hypothetical protein
MTKWERSYLRQALFAAIDEHTYRIESYRIDYSHHKDAYRRPKVVPAEYKADVARLKRKIKIWKILLVKLKDAGAEI